MKKLKVFYLFNPTLISVHFRNNILFIGKPSCCSVGTSSTDYFGSWTLYLYEMPNSIPFYTTYLPFCTLQKLWFSLEYPIILSPEDNGWVLLLFNASRGASQCAVQCWLQDHCCEYLPNPPKKHSISLKMIVHQRFQCQCSVFSQCGKINKLLIIQTITTTLN